MITEWGKGATHQENRYFLGVVTIYDNRNAIVPSAVTIINLFRAQLKSLKNITQLKGLKDISQIKYIT